MGTVTSFPLTTTPTVIAGGGTVARTIADLFSDLPSIKSFGADPSNTAAENSAALALVEAADADVFYVPEGTYQTDATPYQLTAKRFVGPGKLEMSGFAQAPMRSFITSAQPAASTSRLEMFDELGPKQHRASYSFVGSGANPGTLPTSYTNYVEWCADVHVHDFTAGFNTDAADHSLGRSGAFARKVFLYHGGGGDLVADSYYLEVYSSRSGATHFLANPAVAIHNGNIGVSAATGDGAYLQGSEYLFSDRADAAVAAIDRVRNFARVNTGTTLEQVWGCDRIQVSDSAIDFVTSIAGNVKRGWDVTPATFDSDKAAINLKAADRIYLNASSAADSQGIKWFATTLGGTWIEGASELIKFGANSHDGAFIINAAPSAVNGLQSNSVATGGAPQLVAQGSDTNIGLRLLTKGTGVLTAANVAAGWLLTFPAETDTVVGKATTDTLTNKSISGSTNTLSNIANASLTNSSVTVNGTSIALGASETVTAAAGTLTGTTLNATVTASSLTSAAAGFAAGSLTANSNHINVAGYAVISGIAQVNHLWVADAIAAPSAAAGWAKLYVDSADGDLKVIFGDGTIKTLATDT